MPGMTSKFLIVPQSKISKNENKELICPTRYGVVFTVDNIDPFAENVEAELISQLTACAKAWLAVQESQLIES